jgi:uncharacterized protein (DUF983 family)
MAHIEHQVFTHSSNTKPISFLKGKCPRCEQGDVFVSSNPYNLPKMAKMNDRCSHCDLDFNPETGFYWGATYMSYAITVAFSCFTFVVSTLIFGFMNSLSLYYVLVNGILLVLLSPVFFRYSRLSWLWIFYKR